MNNSNLNFKEVLAELKLEALPKFTSITEVCQYVTTYMIKRYDLYDEAQINTGYCFIWAYLVWALWSKDDVVFKTVTGHVVVKCDGYFYDSEHINGSSSTDGFCGFYSSRTEKVVDVRWMSWFWTRNGNKHKEFRRILRRFDPKTYEVVRDNGSTYWSTARADFMGYLHIDKLPEVEA